MIFRSCATLCIIMGCERESLETAPTTVAGIQTFWRHLKKGEVGFPSLGGGRGTLLITAIGNRPGVLYSALLAAPPAACW